MSPGDCFLHTIPAERCWARPQNGRLVVSAGEHRAGFQEGSHCKTGNKINAIARRFSGLQKTQDTALYAPHGPAQNVDL